ncbi:MAG: aspartate aminotransferase family protein [Deltaproteobacteria bacterium]|nr:aspartate aminotransferase family protein [Deltaproteobacteria bacterium]
MNKTKSDSIIEESEKVFANTYKRAQIVIDKGAGATLWDKEGKSYTDFMAGIAVCGLGHCHPAVVNAVKAQAEKLFHISSLYYIEPQTKLASWLVKNSFADRVFFSNSGTEANEAAIKLARKYFWDKGEKNRFKIITALKSFHGRTYGGLSATGQDKIKKGFHPILQGFENVPFNDIKAIEEKTDKTVCAIMLEPVLGEGGIILPEPGYLKEVRKICDRTGALLIFDEIQTGIGRTGKLFGYMNFNVKPDIMTLAKALGNGLPIGAMLAKEDIAKAFVPGSHGSTYGGNPVACAGAFAVAETIEQEKILDNCITQGEYLKKRLNGLQKKYSFIKDVRGIGLMIGAELNIDGSDIVKKALEKGFLINCIQTNILRFIPPLIIKKENINALINALDDIFSNFA